MMSRGGRMRIYVPIVPMHLWAYGGDRWGAPIVIIPVGMSRALGRYAGTVWCCRCWLREWSLERMDAAYGCMAGCVVAVNGWVACGVGVR